MKANNNSLKKYCLLIDLDGVLVDNVEFEERVLLKISEAIAVKQNITNNDAYNLLKTEISKPVEGRDRFRYDYQCKKFDIDDSVWQNAHIECSNYLKKFDDTEMFLQEVASLKSYDIIIISDTTRWVLNFKLNTLKINNFDISTFSQDEALSFKGEKKYWDKIFEIMKGKNLFYSDIIYFENRLDRIENAKKWYPELLGVLILQSEHLEKYTTQLKMKRADFEALNLTEGLNFVKSDCIFRH
jgi:FMN phosphatase YigB (HAD superfamily)